MPPSRISYLVPLSDGSTKTRTGRSLLFPVQQSDGQVIVNFVIQDCEEGEECRVVHRASGNTIGVSLEAMRKRMRDDPKRARQADCSVTDCACYVIEHVINRHGADAFLQILRSQPVLNTIHRDRV